MNISNLEQRNTKFVWFIYCLGVKKDLKDYTSLPFWVPDRFRLNTVMSPTLVRSCDRDSKTIDLSTKAYGKSLRSSG